MARAFQRTIDHQICTKVTGATAQTVSSAPGQSGLGAWDRPNHRLPLRNPKSKALSPTHHSCMQRVFVSGTGPCRDAQNLVSRAPLSTAKDSALWGSPTLARVNAGSRRLQGRSYALVNCTARVA